MITWGTYGARLHGGQRPTVERDHNRPGEDFVWDNPALYTAERNAMNHPPVYLTLEQQLFLQDRIPAICARGGWDLRTCSAGTDHVHVLTDAEPTVHGEQIRELLKRWSTQALNETWKCPPNGRWWAKGGSNKPVKDAFYLNNAFNYVDGQRAVAR